MSQSSGETNKKAQAEVDRQIKLGLLLVNMGIALQDEVFPKGVPRAPPLVSVAKPTAPSQKWYNPLAWFGSSQRCEWHPVRQLERVKAPLLDVIPHVEAPSVNPIAIAERISHEDLEQTSHAPIADVEPQHATEGSSLETDNVRMPDVVPEPATLVSQESSASPAVDVAAPLPPPGPQAEVVVEPVVVVPAQQPNKPKPPPRIDYKVVSDDVLSRLEAAAKEERRKLLGMEENIHGMLETIERTKHKFLVPARELKCEREIGAVVSCYERLNMQGSAVGAMDGRWILKCGEVVKKLTLCSEEILRQYTE